ncbi:MAG: restriction endonuclease [Sulfurimonas sp.]|uniref:restriction endonuclease n=1 Tax=Sulfurimonas sp. TaxID=2022749 RepID=UPI00262CE6CE|nr:restriction endonuclease [Sulfurimonas sp.]MCW8895184.1 restriction endonuclease [Sulfurimonas sp.]MCW8954855.1 restriction endonuclease [Sulfurimonas sp.]MCW9068450.1 restriction endonuclease [Sulfurimonas sp.]
MTTFFIILFISLGIAYLIKKYEDKKYIDKSYKNTKIYNNYRKANNKINTNWNDMYKKDNDNNSTSQSVSDIAIYFNISSKNLNTILEKLQWQEKSGKWTIPTKKGIEQGAEEKYNARTKQKYIMWDIQIKYNKEVLNEVKKIKENIDTKDKATNQYDTIKKATNKMTNKEKKEKGDNYEEYIANFFKKNGYYVWEHGKEKGVKDNSIDLLIKKENYIYFVQCKNWEKWKINHKEVKATRTDIREYLQKNKEFFNIIKSYEQKILYVTSKECLTAGAYKYIEENNEILEYKVIPVE